MILSSGQGQDQVKFRSQKVTILKTHIRCDAHLLWAILHVKYDGDGLFAIRAHLGEYRYKVRSRSNEKGHILPFLILEYKDVCLMQNVPRNPMVPFLSTWDGTPKNSALLYGVTIRLNVVEINIAFGVQKLMYRYEILYFG